MKETSKRLQFFEKMTKDGSDDPLAWYGLAMEYKSLERHDEALQTFGTLRARHSDYVPMYLMCGQMLENLGREDEAREWFEAGITAAKAKKDTHALGELESALAKLE
jgi:tetratricopeptide (TPR) repeat protein